MKEIDAGRGRVVLSWASILDDATLEQAKMTARSEVVKGPVVLMPDAHLGIGATVGSVVYTEGAVIPAAVGVDLGCGMIAVRLNLDGWRLTTNNLKEILGRWREAIPAGVGRERILTATDWDSFIAAYPFPAGVIRWKLEARAEKQFGTLGSGNHFAELSVDTTGRAWLVVHSGSRGVGNALATQHIKKATELGHKSHLHVEHPDLSYLVEGTTEFEEYMEDVRWAQAYAFYQRASMMRRMVESVGVDYSERINCHHNYIVADRGYWLTRKGAISAELYEWGVIPGSMGTATHIVSGHGNVEAYRSAPHGAGRLMGRGAARRMLDVEAFKEAMGGKVWDDWNAEKLLDEAPLAYKPIEVVMEDAKDLVESRFVLNQLVNYKGV